MIVLGKVRQRGAEFLVSILAPRLVGEFPWWVILGPALILPLYIEFTPRIGWLDAFVTIAVFSFYIFLYTVDYLARFPRE